MKYTLAESYKYILTEADDTTSMSDTNPAETALASTNETDWAARFANASSSNIALSI